MRKLRARPARGGAQSFERAVGLSVGARAVSFHHIKRPYKKEKGERGRETFQGLHRRFDDVTADMTSLMGAEKPETMDACTPDPVNFITSRQGSHTLLE